MTAACIVGGFAVLATAFVLVIWFFQVSERRNGADW